MNKYIVGIVCIVLLITGTACLTYGISLFRLPYVDGQYFDRYHAVVRSIASARLYSGLGIFIIALGSILSLTNLRKA